MSVSRETCFKANLFEGKEVSNGDLSALGKEDDYRRCYEASLNLLKYRPRSELELTQRLLRKKFSADIVTKTLIRLKSLSLIDDASFASLWVDNRKTNRSRRLIKLELRQKGISMDITQKVTANIDEEATAISLAQKKAQYLQDIRIGETKDIKESRRKVLTYLLKKGFSYDMSKKAVANAFPEEADFAPFSIDDDSKK